MMEFASLDALASFGVGHAHDESAGTGCTVVVAPRGAVCGVDVRGGGPATRETDLLKPENMVESVHAVVLAGGSAFGLEASCGVMDVLSEEGIGFRLGGACIPIVTGACLFDVLVGENAHPDKAMGAAAARKALDACVRNAGLGTCSCGVGEERPKEKPGRANSASFACGVKDEGREAQAFALEQGNVGAGCGATVGKLGLPRQAMKSGFGYSCLRQGGAVVAALVAVNALGNVCDRSGSWLAGCQTDGRILDPFEVFFATNPTGGESATGDRKAEGDESERGGITQNTTIGVVLTNAKLTKAQATKVSSTTHDAYARAIKPVHTSNDGDTIFTFASGEVESSTDMVAIMAAEAMQQAIENAVSHAKGAYGLPAARDIR